MRVAFNCWWEWILGVRDAVDQALDKEARLFKTYMKAFEEDKGFMEDLRRVRLAVHQLHGIF